MALVLYFFLSVAFNLEAPEAGLVLLPYLTSKQEVIPSKFNPMKLSKLPKLLAKAEQCTSREEAQKILRKSSKLTYKTTITNE